MIVNALGGLENPNLALARPQGDNPVDSSAPDVDARAIRDTRASGCTAVNVTLGYVGGADEPFEYTIRTIGVWDAILRRHADDLAKVHSAADILAAEKNGKIGIIYGFQNGAMMGADASRADIFADLGVRVIQLTYNPANQIGHGCMSDKDTGLSAFGHEVVERLNANRIMVDLSHSGTQTCLEAARVSKAPISINHTGCRALTDLPRNKSDEELRLVASKGGFVGIYFMPFLKSDGHPNAEDVVAHIEHAINVCGEDHIGIATDGSATPIDDLGAYSAFLAKQVEDRRKRGLGATGERADSYPFIVDLRGVDQFRKLSQLLKARGHTETRIDKILGLNFLRYARDVWGA
jgi:membrane dipeptidase